MIKSPDIKTYGVKSGMAKISVIVPIYKVEAYLDKCIQSLVDQTYSDLEIILVDDGSPDRCGEICEEWAKKDTRIRVVHKANGGLSDARNAGLAVATGEYIGFVDSDDWIEPRMYELLYAAMQETGAQIAECTRENFSDTTPATPFEAEVPEGQCYSAEQALAELIGDGDLRQTVWNKLYCAELVKNKLFPVGKINEDEFWTYRVFGEAECIVRIEAALYHYYQRDDSIIHTYDARRLACLEAFEQRDPYLKERFPSLVPMATARWMVACLYHYQSLARSADVDPDRELRKMVHRQFCGIDHTIIKSVVSLKQRLWFWLFSIIPDFIVGMRNRLGIGV